MIFVETNSNCPEVNLAFEEQFLKNYKEPVLMLWQNEPTIVVGRFQNTLEEINKTFVEKNNIRVIRRMTGGGAVYHDMGNLCYSFIVRGITPEEADFSVFAKPMIEALGEIGIVAQQSGRNDILLDGKKISGTAMTLHKDSILFHGTLLYNSDLSMLSKALNVKDIKISSKGHKSVKSRVTNIKPYLDMENLSVLDFKKVLKGKLKNSFKFEEYTISKKTFDDIMYLAENKYKNWEWIYGNNPNCDIKNIKKFSGGILEINIDITKGKISKCIIKGDFLGLCAMEEVETMLIGVEYEKESIDNVLKKIDIKSFFNGITRDEILKCILNED